MSATFERSALRWALAVGVTLAPSLACTFIPPPPLPEELVAQEAEEAERRQAVRSEGEDPQVGGWNEGAGAGEGQAAGEGEGEAGGGDGENPWGYRRGDLADLEMTPEQMQAYARVQGDPREGQFPLAEAIDGIEGTGALWVEMTTTQGPITCRLFEDETPITVANFVGLARGLRPALDDAQQAWVTRPYYDGVAFHRVIPGFVIQGGDPTGTGRGRTGYVIQDEFVAGLLHDEPGKLSMANRGPGTGAGQFFVTLAPLPHLDGKHTVFGECEEAGIQVAEKIAAMRGPSDRPRSPQVIESVRVFRR